MLKDIDPSPGLKELSEREKKHEIKVPKKNLQDVQPHSAFPDIKIAKHDTRRKS